MVTLTVVLKGILLLFYYVTVTLMFIPVRLIGWVGNFFSIDYWLRRCLLLSDERAELIRDDLADSMSEGTRKILQEEGIDTLAVHRHKFRREGLKSVRDVDVKISNGELLVSLTLVLIGLNPSIIPTMVDIQVQLGVFQSTRQVSVLTTVIGLSILILTNIRGAVVSYLMYDDSGLSRGEPPELLTKMVWNQFAANRPAKVIGAYYLLYFGRLVSDGTYAGIRGTLVAGMDPNKTKSQSLRENLPKIIGAVDDESSTD